jgi:hypothetical protein
MKCLEIAGNKFKPIAIPLNHPTHIMNISGYHENVDNSLYKQAD